MSLSVWLVACILNAISGKEIFKLLENNNFPNANYDPVGTWESWITGYHVNDQHDGYLDIGSVTFNAQNLQLLYTVDTNCSNSYPVFANGRLYCTTNNMLLSYYPQNGTVSFWYLSIGPLSLSNPTFATSGDYSSLFMYSYSSNNLYISSFDAMSGELKQSTVLPTYSSSYYSPYATGTNYGQVYLTSRNATGNTNASVYAFNIESYAFTSSAAMVRGPSEIPTLCNNLVVVTGYYAYTDAFNSAPNWQQQWMFPGKGSTTTYTSASPPACFKNANGYRVVVKPYSSSDYTCYVLNTLTGAVVNEFQCGSLPYFHYDKSTGFADIAIVKTSATNQVLAVEMNGDQVFSKELWYGSGNIDRSFIVNDYFVTAWSPSSYIVEVRVYNIFNGDVEFEKTFENVPYPYTYSIAGGLYDDEGEEKFMLIARIQNQLMAFTDELTTTSTTTTTTTA